MLVLASAYFAAQPGSAAAALLYDASTGLPSLPDWLFLSNPPGGLATHDGSVTTVDTLAVTTPDISAGYTYLLTPTLDRNLGFTLGFAARVVEENHVSDHRAGFSVIVLSTDKKGVELAFWEDEIWAQEDVPLFTHGEGVTLDTTAALTQYELEISGDNYFLRIGGVAQLNGPLRDYSSHPHPVYSTPNFLFFGDDTTSAEGRFELGSITLVPEPSTFVLLLAAGAGLALCPWRRERAQT